MCGSLSILWHCLSFGLEWKLIFFSLVATPEFSKFVGVLSAALSQHHLLGFEIAQLEEKGMTVDEIAGWHHRLDGHEFE